MYKRTKHEVQWEKAGKNPRFFDRGFGRSAAIGRGFGAQAERIQKASKAAACGFLYIQARSPGARRKTGLRRGEKNFAVPAPAVRLLLPGMGYSACPSRPYRRSAF